MAEFVLVHAAWHGAWEWRDVARRLRLAGHTVHTPTLTGCGDRAHLLSPDIGLETHLTDVLNVFRWEEVSRAVLVGHSYSGTVVTGVADRIPDQVHALVYMDAFVPQDGQSTSDMTPEWRLKEIRELAAREGKGWFVPPHHAERWVAEPGLRERVLKLAGPHPLRCLEDKLHLTGGLDRVRRKYYVLSEAFKPSPFWQFHDKYRAHPSWKVLRLPTMHDAMISMPDEVTDILLDAAEERR
jgi:pimeloyl-ACP methyl ester carboxylesterase